MACSIIVQSVQYPNTYAMLIVMTYISELSLIAAALATGSIQNWESNKDQPYFDEAFSEWVDKIIKSAEDYEIKTDEIPAKDYGLDAEPNEYIDPILAVILHARSQRDHAERVLKLGIAYARSGPRPYSLRTIAECAKMSPSTVATYFTAEDQATANAIVQEVRDSLPVLFSKLTKE